MSCVDVQNIKAELDQKKGILNAMEAELSKASHWNGQVGGSSHRCDLMLTKYTEDVNMLSDRWRRIQLQLDTRYAALSVFNNNWLLMWNWILYSHAVNNSFHIQPYVYEAACTHVNLFLKHLIHIHICQFVIGRKWSSKAQNICCFGILNVIKKQY